MPKYGKSGPNPKKWIKLGLHNCEENEFVCQNAECIDQELRCDDQYNCRDNSDEDNCKIVNIPKDHFKDVTNPPPAIHYKQRNGLDKDMIYEKLEIQPYLLENKFSTKEKQFLFKLITRMTNVKMNFKSQYQDLMCDLHM